MELTAGSRWHSAVCETEVVVVKAPGTELTLECGGAPVVPLGEDSPAGLELDPAHSGGTQMGKRFADPESGLEVLASKPGAGSLSIDGVALPLKDAKPLPASD